MAKGRGCERERERQNEKLQTFQPQPYKLEEYENMNSKSSPEQQAREDSR